MVAVDPATGVVFCNAAVVPRWRPLRGHRPSAAVGTDPGPGAVGGVARHFTVAELAGGEVRSLDDVWVGVWRRGAGRSMDPSELEGVTVERRPLLRLVGATATLDEGQRRRGSLLLSYEVLDGWTGVVHEVRAQVPVKLPAIGGAVDEVGQWFAHLLEGGVGAEADGSDDATDRLATLTTGGGA